MERTTAIVFCVLMMFFNLNNFCIISNVVHTGFTTRSQATWYCQSQKPMATQHRGLPIQENSVTYGYSHQDICYLRLLERFYKSYKAFVH